MALEFLAEGLDRAVLTLCCLLLEDPVAQVRWSAARALGQLRSAIQQSQDSIARQRQTTLVTNTLCYAALYDADPAVRSQCALTLAEWYRGAESLVTSADSPVSPPTPSLTVPSTTPSAMTTAPDVITVLMLSANPKGTDPLRLDQERRDVEEELRRSKDRDRFRFESRVAVRPVDVRQALLDYEPTIVHFSGHGTGAQGLVLEDVSGKPALVSGEALAGLFELFADRLQCVVLNACYAEVQAQAIVQVIPFVVGMNAAIEDRAALAFAGAFYGALGAGRSVEFAFKLGCSEIAMAGSGQKDVPVLLKKP